MLWETLEFLETLAKTFPLATVGLHPSGFGLMVRFDWIVDGELYGYQHCFTKTKLKYSALSNDGFLKLLIKDVQREMKKLKLPG